MLLRVILNSLVEALGRAPLSLQHMKAKSKQRGGLHDTPPPAGPHFWNLLASLIHHRWAVLMDTLEVSAFLPSSPILCVLCSTPPSRIYFISVYQRGLIFPNCHIIACPSQILPHPFVQIFARSEEVVLLLLRSAEPKVNLYQIFYGNSYMATLFPLAGFY